MSILIYLIIFIAGVITGRYFKVIPHDAQILNDMERMHRILNTKPKDSELFQVISPTKQKEKAELEKAFSEEI